MKRILFKLSISLLTFTIGVSATAIYWLYRCPDVDLPEVTTAYKRSSCFPGLSVAVMKSPVQSTYFPLSGLSATVFGSRNGWYSRHLKAMYELPLAALENEDESYRFLWLRSFHHPVAVHVWRTGDKHYIVVKRLNGAGGYEPGTCDLYWAQSLTENDWDAFMMHLEHSEFWSMPTHSEILMFDGAHWILEGYREGRYHVVDRQSPNDGNYRDACLYLLRKSGLLAEIPVNEVY